MDPSPSEEKPVDLHARLTRLENEVAILRLILTRLSAFADPRAKVAVVKLLTGAPQTLTGLALDSVELESHAQQFAKKLMTDMAG